MAHALEAITAKREHFVRWTMSRVPTSADAEDVVQRAMERAVVHVDQCEQEPVPWFWKILKNTLIDHQRERQRAVRRVERARDLGTIPESTNEPLLCECGFDMIESLPEAQRDVVQRVYVEGETLAEAADALSITTGTARVRAHRARNELRSKIARCCGATTYAQATVCAC